MLKNVTIVFALIVAVANPAAAQYRQPPRRNMPQPMMHKVEITPWVGYAWTFSRRVSYLNNTGDIDIGNSPVWGVEVAHKLVDPTQPANRLIERAERR